MHWVKKARHIYGLSAKELANRAHLSLNYIQRIENGSRPLTMSAEKNICMVFGFAPEEIPLDTRPIIEQLDKLIASGAKSCLAEYRVINERVYYTGVCPLSNRQEEPSEQPTKIVPMRCSHLRECLNAQVILFESDINENLAKMNAIIY